MRKWLIYFLIIILYVSTIWAEDTPNSVLLLDGDGDYVEVADNKALNAIDSQVTMEAWIKPTSFLGEWISVIHKGDKSNRNYAIGLNRNGSIYLVSIRWQSQILSSRGSIKPNNWYHIAGIIDTKNDVMKIFINGFEVAHGKFIPDIDASNLPLRIGWQDEDVNINSSFAIQIDEVRIWNIIRTQEEIRATMHTGLSGKEPGLVDYWRFDDLEATNIKKAANAHLMEAELPGPDGLVIPAVISGVVTNEDNRTIFDTTVLLKQDEEEITRTQTDTSGNYQLVIYPESGLKRRSYNLIAEYGELGAEQTGIYLNEGEYRTLNITLKPAISITGNLLMLDNTTPHTSVTVQAIIVTDGNRSDSVADVTLSDERGVYQFANLDPGYYQIRCHIPDGYIYYSHTGATASKDAAAILRVERGKTLSGIDFRLAPFKKGVWRNYTYLDGLASNEVQTFHRNPDGTVWIGTFDGGVSRYDGKEFVNFTTKDGLASNLVSSICRGPDGDMWFGTGYIPYSGNGVSRYDGKEFVTFTAADGLPNNTVNDIACDSNGVLWFATGRYGKGTPCGLCRYDGEKFISFTTEDGLHATVITSVCPAPDGILWVGTYGGGLYKYNGEQFIDLELPVGYILSLHLTSDGILWIGDHLRGALRYDG